MAKDHHSIRSGIFHVQASVESAYMKSPYRSQSCKQEKISGVYIGLRKGYALTPAKVFKVRYFTLATREQCAAYSNKF